MHVELFFYLHFDLCTHQETRALMRQTAAEVLHVNGTFKNMTDSLMMKEAEVSTSVREVEIGKGKGV